MKTVKDAHEFYGEFKQECWGDYIFSSVQSGKFCFMRYSFAEEQGMLNRWIPVCSIKELEDYAKIQKLNSINKEAIKPVYTQEMADNGELPPVGSECMALFDSDLDEWVKAEVLGHRCNDAGISIASCMLPEKSFILGWFVDFKPIDTRTDGEKLIDEIAEFIGLISEDVECSYESGAKALIEKFGIKLK